MPKNNTAPENNIANPTTDDVSQEQQPAPKDKAAQIKKILIIAIGVLSLVLIVLITTVMLKGDNKEEATDTTTPAVENTNPQVAEKDIVVPEHKDYKFDFNNLDPEKLNEQLSLLTNKNMEIKQIEEQNSAEKEKSINSLPTQSIPEPVVNKEEKALEVKPKEEPTIKTEEKKAAPIISEQGQISTTNDSNNSDTFTTPIIPLQPKDTVQTKITEADENNSQAEDNNGFVSLINVARIKGELNKKYLDKAVSINHNILLCRDDENIIELYYGPFLDDKLRDELFKKLINSGFKEAYTLEMSKEEFDKRCNY